MSARTHLLVHFFTYFDIRQMSVMISEYPLSKNISNDDLERPLSFLQCKKFLLENSEKKPFFQIIQKKPIMLSVPITNKSSKKETNLKYKHSFSLLGAHMEISGEYIEIRISSEHFKIRVTMEGGEIVFTKIPW